METIIMQNVTTTDLSEFGYRELRMAAELLTAYVDNGTPDEFDADGVTVMFNRNSGYVFLTNSEYQVCMLSDDKLEMWYTCPECGEEGFDGDEGFRWDRERGCCSDCAPDSDDDED